MWYPSLRSLLFISILFSTPVSVPVAHAQTAERIASFNASFIVASEGVLSVREEIRYNFGTASRHGIFRMIPYRYKTDIGNFTAEVDVVSVVDERGTPYRFDVHRGGGTLEVKIGDPDITISGEHTYVIEYMVSGPFLYFDDFDELYWNVTGNDWNVPIDSVSGDVALPDGAPILEASCYRGPRGSDTPCDTGDISTSSPNRYTFSSAGLESREGVTIAISFPKGVVYEPTKAERALKFIGDNWAVAVPIVALIGAWYLWYTRGRDPRGRGAIVPMYDPPEGLSPAEVGIVYDEFVHNKDIAAEIVHLAVSGYLRIHQAESKTLGIFSSKDFVLEKLKPGDDLTNEYDRKIMELLFKPGHVSAKEVNGRAIEGVSLKDLSGKFVSEASEIRTVMYRSVVDKGLFVHGPQEVRTWYVILYGLLAAVGFIAGMAIAGSLVTAISFALAGIILMVFAFMMPVRTKAGVLAYEHILGFRDYVHTAERDRLAFHNAPERTPERFDKLLPYAMVLGVEKEWAKQFEDIYHEPRGWYAAAPGHGFSAPALAAGIGEFSSAAGSAAAPASSGSGGGGSSGGGFGGGGGGSW